MASNETYFENRLKMAFGRKKKPSKNAGKIDDIYCVPASFGRYLLGAMTYASLMSEYQATDIFLQHILELARCPG